MYFSTALNNGTDFSVYLKNKLIISTEKNIKMKSSAGATAHKVKSQPAVPTSHMGVSSSPCCSFSNLTLANGLGEQQRMTQVLGHLNPHGKLQGSFWLQISSALASVVI